MSEQPHAAGPDWLDEVRWDAQGLAPAIVQDQASGEVLMLAWMNREALALTWAEQRAVFWSRSRGALWRKGESSGHVQRLGAVRLDCDGDAILLQVEQVGGIACHTGRRRCFYRQLGRAGWTDTDPVIKDPADIYA